MKKILFILVSITLSLTACADNDQLVEYAELPVVAQTFIRKYFNPSDVSYIEREREGMHVEYNVYLKDATEIDFDHQGNLQSIDCRKNAVPEAALHTMRFQFLPVEAWRLAPKVSCFVPPLIRFRLL